MAARGYRKRLIYRELSGSGLAVFERDVAAAAVFADLFLKAGTFIGMEGPAEETFADIIDCLLRRMAHVFRIETVVAQLVHHDFIGREVVGEVEWIHAQVGREPGEKIVDAEQKG